MKKTNSGQSTVLSSNSTVAGGRLIDMTDSVKIWFITGASKGFGRFLGDAGVGGRRERRERTASVAIRCELLLVG